MFFPQLHTENFSFSPPFITEFEFLNVSTCLRSDVRSQLSEPSHIATLKHEPRLIESLESFWHRPLIDTSVGAFYCSFCEFLSCAVLYILQLVRVFSNLMGAADVQRDSKVPSACFWPAVLLS